jgi:hypothetical protein
MGLLGDVFSGVTQSIGKSFDPLGLFSGGAGQGSGLLDGIGGIAGKFLDPLGFLGGDEQKGLSQENRDFIEALFEKYLGTASEESDSACQCEECSSVSDITGDNWQNISISTGSGDDTVTIG